MQNTNSCYTNIYHYKKFIHTIIDAKTSIICHLPAGKSSWYHSENLKADSASHNEDRKITDVQVKQTITESNFELPHLPDAKCMSPKYLFQVSNMNT